MAKVEWPVLVLHARSYDALRALTVWYDLTPAEIAMDDRTHEAVSNAQFEYVQDVVGPIEALGQWALLSVQIEDRLTMKRSRNSVSAPDVKMGDMVALFQLTQGLDMREYHVKINRGPNPKRRKS